MNNQQSSLGSVKSQMNDSWLDLFLVLVDELVAFDERSCRRLIGSNGALVVSIWCDGFGTKFLLEFR